MKRIFHFNDEFVGNEFKIVFNSLAQAKQGVFKIYLEAISFYLQYPLAGAPPPLPGLPRAQDYCSCPEPSQLSVSILQVKPNISPSWPHHTPKYNSTDEHYKHNSFNLVKMMGINVTTFSINNTQQFHPSNKDILGGFLYLTNLVLCYFPMCMIVKALCSRDRRLKLLWIWDMPMAGWQPCIHMNCLLVDSFHHVKKKFEHFVTKCAKGEIVYLKIFCSSKLQKHH